MLRPRRITRYILSELATATLLGIALWTSILLMNDFFFIARQAIQKDLGLETTLTLVVFKIPNMLVLGIPMGTLLGSLIAVGRLSADGEIVALQSAGLGPRQLVRPMLIHGFAAFLASFSIYLLIQPWANYQLRLMQGKILTARNVSTEIRPRVFFSQLPGYVLFVDDIQAGTQGFLERALLYQTAPPQSGRTGASEQLIVAKTATLGPAAGQARLRIVFHDGVAHSFRNDDPESYSSSQFDTLSPAPIELPPWMRPDEAAPDKTVSDMTPLELVHELRAAPLEPDKLLRAYRTRYAEAEAHRRVAVPLASFLFAILALPLGISRVRSGKGAGFALSLGIFLVYYLLFVIGSGQAQEGRIPMAVGMWAANVVIAIGAAVAYARLGGVWRAPRWADALRGIVDGVSRRLPRRRAPERAAGRASFRVSAVLDRYIASTYLKMFGIALAATYLVFSLASLKGLLDAVVERRQPAGLIVDWYKYFIPGALSYTLPFSAMIASVVAVTLLSRSGEVIALKAAGMSARRMCLPIIALTALFCGGLFLVQDRIAPETNRKRDEVRDRIEGRNPRTYGMVPGGRWTFGSDGRLYHYRLFDPQDLKFQGLSVFQVDLKNARILKQWFCATARWKGDAWQAERGWYRSFPEAGTAGEYRRFDSEAITTFDLPANFTRSERSIAVASSDNLTDTVSIDDLSQTIEQLAASGYDTTKLRVAYWEKTANPVMPLVTVLLALPFAFKVGRRGSMYGVGVGLILAIGFWAIAAIFDAFGQESILPPFLAAWSPNVICGAVGSYLLLFIPT